MRETKDNKKICVMFGAGAEICYGLSGGSDFAKNVIDSQKDNDTTKQMNSAIKNYYKNKGSDWHPKYQQDSFKFDKLFKASLKNQLMEEKIDIHNKKGFDDLIERKSRISEQKKWEIIERYTSYMGILDEKFYTIISPKYLGPKKFWGVVACYARAYLLLTGEMVKKTENRNLAPKDYFDMLKNPLKYYRKWSDIQSKKESYYDVIKNCGDGINDISVITTNYTPICENITGIKDIAYVNGRLNWFESAYELKVYDIIGEAERPRNGDIWFPYIFIQSGVKPIIEEKQITEYAKMMNYIKQAETIIIVGYRINADDNHINSFLRSAVLSNKKVFYLNHNSELTDEQIYKRLRIDKITDEIKNVEIVKTDDKICVSKFKEMLCSCVGNMEINA